MDPQNDQQLNNVLDAFLQLVQAISASPFALVVFVVIAVCFLIWALFGGERRDNPIVRLSVIILAMMGGGVLFYWLSTLGQLFPGVEEGDVAVLPSDEVVPEPEPPSDRLMRVYPIEDIPVGEVQERDGSESVKVGINTDPGFEGCIESATFRFVRTENSDINFINHQPVKVRKPLNLHVLSIKKNCTSDFKLAFTIQVCDNIDEIIYSKTERGVTGSNPKRGYLSVAGTLRQDWVDIDIYLEQTAALSGVVIGVGAVDPNRFRFPQMSSYPEQSDCE